jgi:hypothetical protein
VRAGGAGGRRPATGSRRESCCTGRPIKSFGCACSSAATWLSSPTRSSSMWPFSSLDTHPLERPRAAARSACGIPRRSRARRTRRPISSASSNINGLLAVLHVVQVGGGTSVLSVERGSTPEGTEGQGRVRSGPGRYRPRNARIAPTQDGHFSHGITNRYRTYHLTAFTSAPHLASVPCQTVRTNRRRKRRHGPPPPNPTVIRRALPLEPGTHRVRAGRVRTRGESGSRTAKAPRTTRRAAFRKPEPVS